MYLSNICVTCTSPALYFDSREDQTLVHHLLHKRLKKKRVSHYTVISEPDGENIGFYTPMKGQGIQAGILKQFIFPLKTNIIILNFYWAWEFCRYLMIEFLGRAIAAGMFRHCDQYGIQYGGLYTGLKIN